MGLVMHHRCLTERVSENYKYIQRDIRGIIDRTMTLDLEGKLVEPGVKEPFQRKI